MLRAGDRAVASGSSPLLSLTVSLLTGPSFFSLSLFLSFSIVGEGAGQRGRARKRIPAGSAPSAEPDAGGDPETMT